MVQVTSPVCDDKKIAVTVIGHRGCGSSSVGGTSVYPENSLFSFKKAFDLEIDGVELDVWLTKDDQIVVLHGTTDGKLGHTLLLDENIKDSYVEELTSEEIQSFHFKEPWILTQPVEKKHDIEGKDQQEGEDTIEEMFNFSRLSENEKNKRTIAYGASNDMYMNLQENEQIEKIVHAKSVLDFVKKNIEEEEDMQTECTDEGTKENEDRKEEEQQFIGTIKCKHCKIIYQSFLEQKKYTLQKKQVIFNYLSMFYHVPLLKNILDIFKDTLSYDIELKGSKEQLGVHLLELLKDYSYLKIKFSSFHWVLQDDQIKKKIHKNKNLKQVDYASYPFYNVRKIDLLKVLRNNKLNIPIALLFEKDTIMPNINTILCSMKYYSAEWVHFSYTLNQHPIILNCNKKNKIISTEEFIQILHKNKKKIMIYWGSQDKDLREDVLFYIKAKVNSICPNDIMLAKNIIMEENSKQENQEIEKEKNKTEKREETTEIENGDINLLVQKKEKLLSVC